MARPTVVGRFVKGAAALPQAIGFVLARPSLWPLVLAPSLVTLVVVLVAGEEALRWGAGFLHQHIAHAHGLLSALVMIALFVFVGAVAYLAFLVVGVVAAAPFAGPLSKRTERLVRGEAPAEQPSQASARPAIRQSQEMLEEVGLLRDLVTSLVHVILQLIVYLSVTGTLLVAHFLMPPLAPVTVALGLVATALFLAWDAWDPPLSRRGAGFARKWGYVARHLPEALGFGGVVALLLAVPGLGLIVPPVAAVAGTRLYLGLENEV